METAEKNSNKINRLYPQILLKNFWLFSLPYIVQFSDNFCQFGGIYLIIGN